MKMVSVLFLLLVASLATVASARVHTRKHTRKHTRADEYPQSQDDKVDDDAGEASLGDMELKAELAHAKIASMHSRMANAEATHSNVRDELDSVDAEGTTNEVATNQDEPSNVAPGPQDEPSEPAENAAPAEIADPAETAELAEPATVSAVRKPSRKMSEESDQQQDMQTDVQGVESEEPSDKADLMATGSGAAASSESAGGSDDGFDATEKSLDMFHKRYAVEKQQTKHLRQELAKADDWGKSLQTRLRGNLKAFNEKDHQTKLFMAQKAKEEAAAMLAEKKREHVLESLFAKANRTLSERAQQLTDVETELNATRKERATLSASALRALRAERKQEAKLQNQLTKTKAGAKSLKSKLDHGNGELKVAKTEWKAEEMRLLKADTKEKKRNARLEANVTKLAGEVRKLKLEKSNEDQVLASFKAKSKQVLNDAQQKLSAARGRELTLRKALDGDHKKREHDETTLQKELAVWKKRADNAQASAQQLGREVKLRASGDREEMKELKKKLDYETREAKHLEKERSNLDSELRANVTKRSQLEDEVVQLRQQLKEGAAARKKAEGTAKKAQQETAQAQAVAKQLSGTVPRLLEQAQLAHERRDAMAAITQSQDSPKIGSSTETSLVSKNTTNNTSEELSQLPSDDLAAAVEQAAATEDDDKQVTQNATSATADASAAVPDDIPAADDAIPAAVPDADALDSADNVVQKIQDDAESSPKPAATLDSDSAGLSQLLGED